MTTISQDGITIDIDNTTARLTIDGQFAATMDQPNWRPDAAEGDRVFAAIANMTSYAQSVRPSAEYVNAALVTANLARLNDFRNAVRGYTAVHPAESVVNLLVGEGNDRADVVAVIDSLIDAGLSVTDDTATGDRWITDVEVGLLRDQLASTTP